MVLADKRTLRIGVLAYRRSNRHGLQMVPQMQQQRCQVQMLTAQGKATTGQAEKIPPGTKTVL